jgi:acid phosphatase family membrane protein YuiD
MVPPSSKSETVPDPLLATLQKMEIELQALRIRQDKGCDDLAAIGGLAAGILVGIVIWGAVA